MSLLIVKCNIFLLVPDYSFHDQDREKNFTVFIMYSGWFGEMHTTANITALRTEALGCFFVVISKAIAVIQVTLRCNPFLNVFMFEISFIHLVSCVHCSHLI